MAFQSENNQSGSTNSSNSKTDAPTGYLNFYIPSRDGSRKKLGAIALKDSNTNQKALREWLDADEANAQRLLQAIELEYTSVSGAPAEFDLPGFGQ